MRILYINPLDTVIVFLILGGTETLEKTLPKNTDTASLFPKVLVDLVDQYGVEEIWCITGPGPFTLMRVITLSINALRYTRDITLRSSHFFDLIPPHYTPIIEANAGEYLIRENGVIVTQEKGSLKDGTYEGIIGEILSTDTIKYIHYKEDQCNIDHIFSTKSPESRISPIYFKPPHITCPKP